MDADICGKFAGRATVIMSWKFIGDLDFFETWRSVQKYLRCMMFLAQIVENYRDEARHGKAFEGLLKRYFN